MAPVKTNVYLKTATLCNSFKAGNIARGLGFDSQIMANVIRLYMFLHADHEGNVFIIAATCVGYNGLILRVSVTD